jgi:lauroyl/myristoyl acyltransferase
MKVILPPTAYFFPWSWTTKLVKTFSLLLLALPWPGMRVCRTMRIAFGQDLFRSWQLTWEWLAGPLQDYAFAKHVIYGGKAHNDWKIVERNAEAVAKLRESGQSFVVATAHFRRTAYVGVLFSQVTPGNIFHVVVPPGQETDSLSERRLRLHYDTLLKALATGSKRHSEFAYPKDARSARKLFEIMRENGNTLVVHLDAPWEAGQKGSFSRPFASQRSRVFSTGAARLAKLTKRPIVSCAYWQEDDGTCVVKWGTVIARVDDEIDAMNTLIDELEVAIGEHPAQYVLTHGRERRWNSSSKRWEDLSDT